MNLKTFLTSKVFLKQLLASVGLTLAVVLMVLLMLRAYTHHGEAYPVPDLLGMSKEEFSDVLDDVDLKFRVVDSTYNENIAAGGVVDQVPEAGHKVKRNRIIYLTLNASSPGNVAIPRLTDISYRQAVVQLETAGLVPGNISYEPSEFQNLVLKAKLNGREVYEGEAVVKGTVIDLVLGSGSGGGLAILPDLRGMSLDEARGALSGSSLVLGSIFFDEPAITYADSLSARIYRQHPGPEFSLQTNAGSSVDVWLTANDSKVSKAKTENQGEFDY